MMRVLSAIRLSVLTDETTSPARQRDANKDATAHLGGVIIGEAVDLDVSATKTSPFDRPELGKWLASPDSFDAIAWWRQDRAVRSMDDMHTLSAWAREHRKLLIFNEGPGGGRLILDFRNPLEPITQLMVTVFAFAAQMESQAIKERVTGAQAALRNMEYRWRGGWVPYGYKPVKREDGAGLTLEVDPETVPVIERMIRELSEGVSWTGIAEGLRRDGIPNPRNHSRRAHGKPDGKEPWSHASVRAVLTSPSLLGYKLYQKQIVRNPDGEPVRVTRTPILSREEWDHLQSVIKSRSREPVARRDTTGALLLGVLHCSCCGSRCYLNKRGGKGEETRAPNYICGSRQKGIDCNARASVRGDWIEEYVEREFLRRLGGVRVHETRHVPGCDPRPEIEEVSAELEAHYAKQGTQRSSAARAAWERHAEALDARLAALEAMPVVESHTEYVATSRTYAEEWKGAAEDPEKRRQMLLSAGVRVTVERGRLGKYYALDENRVRFVITDEFHADAALELAALRADVA